MARCCETTVGVVGGGGGTGYFSDSAAIAKGNCLALANADVVGCVVIGVEYGWGTLGVVSVGVPLDAVTGKLRNDETSRQTTGVRGRRLKNQKPIWSTTGRYGVDRCFSNGLSGSLDFERRLYAISSYIGHSTIFHMILYWTFGLLLGKLASVERYQ